MLKLQITLMKRWRQLNRHKNEQKWSGNGTVRNSMIFHGFPREVSQVFLFRKNLPQTNRQITTWINNEDGKVQIGRTISKYTISHNQEETNFNSFSLQGVRRKSTKNTKQDVGRTYVIKCIDSAFTWKFILNFFIN